MPKGDQLLIKNRALLNVYCSLKKSKHSPSPAGLCRAKQQATSCDILSRDKINNRQKQQASSDKLRQY